MNDGLDVANEIALVIKRTFEVNERRLTSVRNHRLAICVASIFAIPLYCKTEHVRPHT